MLGPIPPAPRDSHYNTLAGLVSSCRSQSGSCRLPTRSNQTLGTLVRLWSDTCLTLSGLLAGEVSRLSSPGGGKRRGAGAEPVLGVALRRRRAGRARGRLGRLRVAAEAEVGLGLLAPAAARRG
jgi:hypothetical protein